MTGVSSPLGYASDYLDKMGVIYKGMQKYLL